MNYSFLAVKVVDCGWMHVSLNLQTKKYDCEVVDLVKSKHYTCDEYGVSAMKKDIAKFCVISGIPEARLAVEKYTIKSEPFTF